MLYEVITGGDLFVDNVVEHRVTTPEAPDVMSREDFLHDTIVRDRPRRPDHQVHVTPQQIPDARADPTSITTSISTGMPRITSYNVCYTKLLRAAIFQ